MKPSVDPRRRTLGSDSPPIWLARSWLYSGIAGMILSVVAAVFYAFAIGPWVNSFSDSLQVTGQALETVDGTVVVIDDSLVVLSDTLDGIEGVFGQTEATLAEVSRVMLSTAGLLNDEIPTQIDSIGSAMDGLIDTANIVDGILGALSFVGVDYDPTVPLDEALIDVNTRLAELGDSLSSNSADLFSLTVSTNRLNDEISATGDSLSSIVAQVEESRTLIASYRATAADAQVVIAEASARLEGQIWIIRTLGVALLLLASVAFSAVWWMGARYV